jgi:general secretion pathway protein B
MSFILDALKKSETERQRQTVPGLMDARASQRRGRLPLWAVALAVLLAVNLLVLTFVLVRKSAPAAPAARQVDAPPAAGVDAPPAVRHDVPSAAAHFSPLDAAPVYAPEIAAADGGAAPLSPAARASPAHPAHRPDPVLSDADANNEETLPTISEISLSGAQALPELHLDVHVFATNPAERFVYINMRKYHEGAALQEGPILERIRRDGVVLNYQGLRFILPRQP